MGNYAAVVLADKPIRYYRLGETSGTTAYDQSSNLSNGTLHGGITLNQASLLAADTDAAMLFNGTSGYISLSTSGLPTGASPFTFECWMNAGTNTDQAVFVCGTDAPSQSIGLYYASSTGIFDLYTGADHSTASNTAQVGIIHHLVVAYNGATLKLYINSLVKFSLTITMNLTYGIASLCNDAYGDFFAGTLDEFAIYNTALSATQINNHYLAGIGAINFPVVPLTMLARDGHMTATTRDGRSLTTQTRGNPG